MRTIKAMLKAKIEPAFQSLSKWPTFAEYLRTNQIAKSLDVRSSDANEEQQKSPFQPLPPFFLSKSPRK